MITIDYVVPMVFPDDKQWQYTLAVAKGMAGTAKGCTSNVRYRSWDTERLLVRCVRRNMPWLRDIIILLARPSQVRPWMKEEGVRVVYHREFMPKHTLPTFSSSAIETFLPFIPGLSEHFLYGNDDMFPLSPLKVEDFFRCTDNAEDGRWLPCQHHNEVEYPQRPNGFHQLCLNGLNLVASEFGKRYTTTYLKGGHSIAPLLKSTGEYLWRRYEKKLTDSVTPFRRGYNYNQYIYSYWQHLSGQYVDSVPERRYVSTHQTPEEVCDAIRSCQGILCINDNEVVSDIRPYAEMVRNEIRIRLR